VSGDTFFVSALCCAHDDGSDVACVFHLGPAINPHMGHGTAIDLGRARRQHVGLVRALREAGGDVVVVPFVHGAPDSVFVKDAAVLVDDGLRKRALLGRARHAARQSELPARAQDLADRGFVVEEADDVLEGGDVVVGGAAALLGWGQRSSLGARPALERFLGREVVPLELVDAALFHLDMAVSVLDDGTCFACRAALAPASFHALAQAPGIERVVEVSHEDARAFGVNLVEVGDVVVVGGGAPGAVAAVRAAGRRAVVVAGGALQKAGGCAACLVNRVLDAAPATALRSLLDERSTWA
jgi:N-dimethylarginine dimethylaminohydrolase